MSAAPAPPAEEPGMSTPAPADEGIVVVDVEPSPAAMKFIGTIKATGEQLGSLESTDVSDGMFELSKQYTKSAKDSFAEFKEHALDGAVVITAAEAPEEGRWRTVAKQTDWRKVAQLPMAAIYAIIALVCVVTFAAVYYPKMYGPVLLGKAKAKFIEWQVAEKVGVAKEAIVDASSKAYTAAASSDLAAKGTEALAVGREKAATAYTTVMAQPVVQAATTKSGAVAEQLRAKVADELVKLRAEPTASPRVANGTV